MQGWRCCLCNSGSLLSVWLHHSWLGPTLSPCEVYTHGSTQELWASYFAGDCQAMSVLEFNQQYHSKKHQASREWNQDSTVNSDYHLGSSSPIYQGCKGVTIFHKVGYNMNRRNQILLASTFSNVDHIKAIQKDAMTFLHTYYLWLMAPDVFE